MPTPQEIAIMDAWEDGLGPRAISEKLGMPEKRVRRVLDYMRGESDLPRFKRMAREGSERLAQAIAAYYARRA